MKNGFDIITDVISLINVDEIKNLLDGGIWPSKRPNNSDKTDIVVNVLTNTNEMVQEAEVNIRIHSSNTIKRINGAVQSYPDFGRLNGIANALTPFLDQQYKSTFWAELPELPLPFRNNDGTWFILIKLHYKSYNKHYKNI